MKKEEFELYLTTSQIENKEEQSFFFECQKSFASIELIKKAYFTAKYLHQDQKRESGEPYITHPLRVASILLKEIKLVDCNSICAALLHDTIEDTDIKEEFIKEQFNEKIADLVDGVTKINQINFLGKEKNDELNNAIMLRKILSNPKILLIKDADRIDNMRTLEYKKDPNKRFRKAIETDSFFVPINYLIGMRKVAQELEDRCFEVLSPTDYKNALSSKENYIKRNDSEMQMFQTSLKKYLLLNGMDVEIVYTYASVYQTYKGLLQYHKLKKMPDFVTFKIIVKEKKQYYDVLQVLRKIYEIKNFYNYIKAPNINGFRAISFYIEDIRPISFEISTSSMARINDYGYAGIFQDYTSIAEKIIESSIFMQILSNISKKYKENFEFYSQVNKSLLMEHIKIYTPKGKVIWMPKGSSLVDFAYQIHTEVGSSAIGAIVNGNLVEKDYILHNNDTIEVLTNKQEEITRKRKKLKQ